MMTRDVFPGTLLAVPKEVPIAAVALKATAEEATNSRRVICNHLSPSDETENSKA
jgi:hypothetical protein